MMKDMPEGLKKTCHGFLADVKSVFGDSLVSVILYGAAVRGENAATPYITFLVVVRDNTPSALAPASNHLKNWKKQLIAMPLFLTQNYIDNSLDTFPLEFLNMSTAYHVVFGVDVLDDLVLTAADIRNQCEREIKGKLLHLRAEYIELRGDTKNLIDLAARSLSSFRLVFIGALRLKGGAIPPSTAALLEAVTTGYGLDVGFFKKLTAVSGGEMKIGNKEADEFFDRYVEELDKLSGALDTMEC